MAIDPNKPVRLLRLIDDNEDAYYPGVYQPGRLPTKYLIEGVVSQVGDGIPGVISAYSDVIQTQSIHHLTAVLPTQSQNSYGSAPTPVVNLEGQAQSSLTLTIDPPAKLEINTVSLDQLISVFGAVIANALVEERQKKLFLDLADIKKRIKQANWDIFSDRIIF
jgi:DNA uptake protein ComE-like DNA-binding protein